MSIQIRDGAETTSQFRWEQDGAGGDDGKATFFVGTDYEITVRIDTFKQAFDLENAINQARRVSRQSGRADLAAQVRRVLP